MALDNSGLVGLLMILLEQPGEFPIVQPAYIQAVIDNLVVDEQARGKKVGRRMMEQAEIWAKERKARELRLQVYEQNRAAKAFYEALAFEPLSHVLRKRL